MSVQYRVHSSMSNKGWKKFLQVYKSKRYFKVKCTITPVLGGFLDLFFCLFAARSLLFRTTLLHTVVFETKFTFELDQNDDLW
jgi:hypothetical protein